MDKKRGIVSSLSLLSRELPGLHLLRRTGRPEIDSHCEIALRVLRGDRFCAGYLDDVAAFKLETARLALREWRSTDALDFAALNAYPNVMEFFTSVLSRVSSDALLETFREGFAEQGFCPFAVEKLTTREFIGFVGLQPVADGMPAADGVEIGWRPASAYWGQGYATEAARAALQFGFGACGLEEIVAFTSVPNIRSQAVMVRLGMHRDPADDFDHPTIPEGHRLRRHVLYRITP